jgi:hypothetical protein
MNKELLHRLKKPQLLKELNKNNEVGGYQSAKSGRITYNKIVDSKSFAIFTDIISDLIPHEIVYDSDNNHKLVSMAKILNYQPVYPRYLYMNATMVEYMDYEDEEDQENMDKLCKFVDKYERKTPVVGLVIQKSEAMESAHAIAFIIWKVSSKRYRFAYYDPLAYKKGEKSYDFAERAFISSRFTQKIEFINLNTYCFHKSEAEFHCTQYVINAEYCYVYCLYFLTNWIEGGTRLHRGSFRKAITSTYIVKPEKLTRANTKESMIYRVMMMSFICETLLKYLPMSKIKEKKEHMKRVVSYLKEFKATYGFDLV